MITVLKALAPQAKLPSSETVLEASRRLGKLGQLKDPASPSPAAPTVTVQPAAALKWSSSLRWAELSLKKPSAA
jgi:hypothetical protein